MQVQDRRFLSTPKILALKREQSAVRGFLYSAAGKEDASGLQGRWWHGRWSLLPRVAVLSCSWGALGPSPWAFHFFFSQPVRQESSCFFVTLFYWPNNEMRSILSLQPRGEGGTIIHEFIINLRYLRVSTSLFPDVQCNPVRLFFSGQQVDVVSNEKFARSCNSRAPIRYKICWSEIWFPFRFGKLDKKQKEIRQQTKETGPSLRGLLKVKRPDAGTKSNRFSQRTTSVKQLEVRTLSGSPSYSPALICGTDFLVRSSDASPYKYTASTISKCTHTIREIHSSPITQSTFVLTWHTKFHGQSLAKLFCTLYALFHRNSLHRNEWANVQRSETRMFTWKCVCNPDLNHINVGKLCAHLLEQNEMWMLICTMVLCHVDVMRGHTSCI